MKENNYEDPLKFLKALQERSPAAYRQLYQVGFQNSLKYIQARGGSREEVEDLFQEALVIFSTKVEQAGFTLKKNVKVEGFLMGILKICWWRWCEEKQKIATLKEELPPSDLITLLPDDTEEPTLKSRLKNAIEKLSDKCKKLVLDYYYGRFQLKDIAEEIGYKPDSVKTIKHRCVRKLRTIMDERETFI